MIGQLFRPNTFDFNEFKLKTSKSNVKDLIDPLKDPSKVNDTKNSNIQLQMRFVINGSWNNIILNNNDGIIDQLVDRAVSTIGDQFIDVMDKLLLILESQFVILNPLSHQLTWKKGVPLIRPNSTFNSFQFLFSTTNSIKNVISLLEGGTKLNILTINLNKIVKEEDDEFSDDESIVAEMFGLNLNSTVDGISQTTTVMNDSSNFIYWNEIHLGLECNEIDDELQNEFAFQSVDKDCFLEWAATQIIHDDYYLSDTVDSFSDVDFNHLLDDDWTPTPTNRLNYQRQVHNSSDSTQNEEHSDSESVTTTDDTLTQSQFGQSIMLKNEHIEYQDVLKSIDHSSEQMEMYQMHKNQPMKMYNNNPVSQLEHMMTSIELDNTPISRPISKPLQSKQTSTVFVMETPIKAKSKCFEAAFIPSSQQHNDEDIIAYETPVKTKLSRYPISNTSIASTQYK
ncbi:hypothetical protein HDV02_000835 [Globomyces sp. JEL0801]|nr:hypothetical protein HDV02_000835 [Globomyces sp. JEL0801]